MSVVKVVQRGSGRRTVVGKVEAAVDPDTVVRDGHVLLGIDGPLALGGDPFSLRSVSRRAWGVWARAC